MNMDDILVIKVNMFCRTKELNDIRKWVLGRDGRCLYLSSLSGVHF